MSNMQPEKLTKKDLIHGWFFFNLSVSHCVSYARFGGTTFGAALAKPLAKLYKDPEMLREALTRESEFFITDYVWGSVIPGLILSLEEERANGNEEITPDMMRTLKCALMGPMAGFGDTINQSIIKTMTIAYAQPLAVAGNPIASLIGFLGACFYRWIPSYFMFMAGYKQGRNAVTNVMNSKLIKNVMSGSVILAMCVMGAMTASYVSMPLSVSITNVAGEATTLNAIIDKMLPGVFSLGPVFLMYYLIGKKKVPFVRCIIYIMIFSLIMAVLGLAKAAS